MTKYIATAIKIKVFSFSILFLTVMLNNSILAEPKQNTVGAIMYPIKAILADRVLGQLDATVTIIEYASMTCPHCAEFHVGAFQTLKKEYIETGKVKFIYRDYPLDRLALAAAMMARCAPKERYYPILDIIFKTQGNWAKQADPTAALSQIGLLSGISKKTYNSCLSNKNIYQGVMKIRNEGGKKFNIQSTPTILINGEKIKGPITSDKLRLTVDLELEKIKTNKR